MHNEIWKSKEFKIGAQAIRTLCTFKGSPPPPTPKHIGQQSHTALEPLLKLQLYYIALHWATNENFSSTKRKILCTISAQSKFQIITGLFVFSKSVLLLLRLPHVSLVPERGVAAPLRLQRGVVTFNEDWIPPSPSQNGARVSHVAGQVGKIPGKMKYDHNQSKIVCHRKFSLPMLAFFPFFTLFSVTVLLP